MQIDELVIELNVCCIRKAFAPLFLAWLFLIPALFHLNLIQDIESNFMKSKTSRKSNQANITKTACTLLPYSILDLIKVDTTYLRTVILTASCLYSTVKIPYIYSINQLSFRNQIKQATQRMEC